MSDPATFRCFRFPVAAVDHDDDDRELVPGRVLLLLRRGQSPAAAALLPQELQEPEEAVHRLRGNFETNQ